MPPTTVPRRYSNISVYSSYSTQHNSNITPLHYYHHVSHQPPTSAVISPPATSFPSSRTLPIKINDWKRRSSSTPFLAPGNVVVYDPTNPSSLL
uniref:Uncharacterized protein n=1 Tax=Heterorhabditis bacteriophora TaxID=37862 RepID=A0A1I7XFM9_HETBA